MLLLLTLFALVLAIGIVVDDAIVVVEAVHSKMERTKLSARAATIQSMNEISGAIVSITLVMAAVFIPVGFMEGPAGVFYRQFAFTLAIAILISAINALTLSPALCALFLTNPHSEEDASGKKVKNSFGSRFFSALLEEYSNTHASIIIGIRSHVSHVLNSINGFFNGRGHRACNHFGIRTGIKGSYLHTRWCDIRK